LPFERFDRKSLPLAEFDCEKWLRWVLGRAGSGRDFLSAQRRRTSL